jgi:hypothetical protein
VRGAKVAAVSGEILEIAMESHIAVAGQGISESGVSDSSGYPEEARAVGYARQIRVKAAILIKMKFFKNFYFAPS